MTKPMNKIDLPAAPTAQAGKLIEEFCPQGGLRVCPWRLRGLPLIYNLTLPFDCPKNGDPLSIQAV